MDSVIRGVAIYLFLVLIFRIAGKRTLGQITTFDFVLLLIIAEATQQGLLGDDFSLVNGFILIGTLIGFDILLAQLKERSERLSKVLDGVPLILVEEGKLLQDRMRKARVDESDILTAARELQGLERMDQVKYAVLERSGGISIIPK